MDYQRRHRAENTARVIWVSSGVLGIFVALPLMVVGFLVGIFAGFWWLLWVGLGFLGLCVLAWLFSFFSAMGVARADVEEAAARFIAEKEAEQERQAQNRE